jgi:hypothetical protein
VGLKKKRKGKLQFSKEDHLFFHDIMSQTHGLRFFLQGRGERDKPLTPQECLEMAQELKFLQLVFKDHFQFNYKIKGEDQDWGSWREGKKMIGRLLGTLVPLKEPALTFSIKEEDKTHSPYGGPEIHLPSFYRIMSNIIINSIEHGSGEVEISLFCDQEVFMVQVRNQKAITSRPHATKNLFPQGLKSIETLVGRFGGKMNYSLKNNNFEIMVSFTEQVLDKANNPKAA